MNSLLWGLAVASALTAVSAAEVAAQTPPSVGNPTFEPGLADDDEATNLSGAACIARAAEPVCLLVGDEKRYARYFTVRDEKLVPQEIVPLLPLTTQDEPPEADAEGVAYDDGYFYVIGSHSTKRNGQPQTSRHHLYRVKVDMETGRPTGPDSHGALSETRDLDAIIAADPVLSKHVGEAPGEGAHGVNIEGIAVSRGTIFIGFRGPVEDGRSTILTLPTYFGAAQAENFTSCRLPLGEGQGVRDLLAYGGGILILAGPEMRWNKDEPLPHSTEASRLFFWNGREDLRRIAELPVQYPDGAEAITLLGEGEAGVRLLVLTDGPGKGRPAIYDVALSTDTELQPAVTCAPVTSKKPSHS